MKNFIAKYKILIILFLIAFAAVALASFFSSKKGIKPTPTPQATQSSSGFTTSYTQTNTSDYTPPVYTKPAADASGQINLNSEKVLQSIANKEKLTPLLPIYIKDFPTSVDLATTINIYTNMSDEKYQIRIDIYGINYQIQDTNIQTNPQVQAFIESFKEVKNQLTKKGVDIKNIYFIFGDRVYIQKTAELWIRTFNLL